MAFGIGPVLTMAAVDALTTYGSDRPKQRYLPKLVSGEWMGTMQLTEPQAGSDVGALRTKAVRAGDGTYRITGQKIFITYGEHDLTDNIIHFVLARLPDAPAGTKGISLFLVPKFLSTRTALGARNDVRAHSIEHKMGIHASPTCTMVYGDKGGAVGYLVGEENKGLACMFTMMNRARLAVGLQGVGIAERATQQALALCARAQAGPRSGAAGSSAIIEHPDVKRMLLTMRALTARRARDLLRHRRRHRPQRAARTMPRARRRTIARRCSHRSPRPSPPISASRSRHLACRCMAAWASSRRPARRSTTATPASPRSTKAPTASRRIDLVTRKMPMAGGAAVRAYIDELRATVKAVQAANDPAFGATGTRLAEAVDSLERATRGCSERRTAGRSRRGDALSAAVRQRGRRLHAGRRSTGRAADNGDRASRVAIARFFAENHAVKQARSSVWS